ncbi:ankyrin repeat-containing domain protein [Russula ochroleuca]|uniref:Ankyrin repeat-containing domain protein n=1 Tax=Russula ochroleuca TaxID=152965 RepID=A0A9P5K0E7_9AGAM|nr:ankyrin repeat-containing domain protein [Russula ochroleuca]
MDDLAPQPSPRSATPLYYAALCGFGELVSYLADMYPKDRLWHAVARGIVQGPPRSSFYGRQPETMRLLLNKDADVDARGASGNTLLHYAALDGDGQLDFVDLLLERNPDLNAKNENGWTPLHCSVAWTGRGREVPPG